MSEPITLEVHLQAFVRQETTRRWMAICPMVGVASQGKSEDDAKRCLPEAIELWFESCVDRGVLDQALREANFRPMSNGRTKMQAAGRAPRSKSSAKRSVLGSPFEVHLTIPAYEAAALLSATA